MRSSLVLLAALVTSAIGAADLPENFRRENLVAWCVVPFDAGKRGPEERSRMMSQLGLNRVAYDWRAEHVAEFEREIVAYQKQNLEMTAFWAGHEEAFVLFEKHGIRPQVWKTLGGKSVTEAADAMEPLAKRTGEIGCSLGLYNHGGWGGEPENLVAVCEELHRRGHDHVGIVYNFHHAHDHFEDWAAKFEAMKPHLLCLNLNGMVPGGDKEGKKILAIGQGTEESGMIRTVIESGYEGPIGILDHRNETDTRQTLEENLAGLADVLREAGYGNGFPDGRWSFELPDGNPAWLRHRAGAVDLLWSVGSARPAREVSVAADELVFSRKLSWKPGGKADDVRVIEGPFRASVAEGGDLILTFSQHPEGKPEQSETIELAGKALPPHPAKPDLSQVNFGEAIELFDGESLSGWKLSNPEKTNGWRAENGELVNETPKTDFGAYGDYGNLVTEQAFGDFRLTLEYQVPPGGNSGVYLRGMYEAQVVDRDSPMQGISGPGAIFGRIRPMKNAGKPGDEWNRYVLTLVDQHVTVELNGEVVIDNALVEGCTGGGLSADDTAPGPIFLQGDHTSVRYRNIVLEPVIR